MTEALVVGVLAVAGLNAVAGLWGGWLWYRGGPTDRRSLTAFWVLLRIGQGSAVLMAVAIAVLAAAGKYSSDHLFYLYALLPLAVAFVAEQLRVASAQTILDKRGLDRAGDVGELTESEQREIVAEIVRREMGVMATSALVVVFLALRAASTAHGF